MKLGDDKISDVYQSKTETERDTIKENYRVSSILRLTHFSPVLRFIEKSVVCVDLQIG